MSSVSASFDIDVEVAITKKYTQSDVKFYGVRGGKTFREHSYNVGSSWQDTNRIVIGNASYNSGAVFGCVSTSPCVSDDNRGILTFRNGKSISDVIGKGRVVKDASFSVWNQTTSTALHPNGVKYATFMLDPNKAFNVSNIDAITYTNYMNYLNQSSAGVKGKGEVTVKTGDWNELKFDISNILQSWQNSGSHRAIELRAISDGAGGNVKSSNVFYNHHSNSVAKSRQPSITITTVKEEPISPNLPLNSSEFFMRPFTANDRSSNLIRFGALGFDDAVAPGSRLDVDIVSDKGSSVFKSNANAISGYRIFSQYTQELGYQLIDKAQTYYRLTSNVQIPSLFYNTNLQTNTVYSVKYKVSKGSQAGTWKTSDTFIIYKATGYDRLERLLAFYGVSDKDQFMRDNNMSDSLIASGNVLFIRNPKKNQTLSYQIQSLNENDKRMIDADLLGRNQHCEYGYEPINLNTGNFYYSNDDLGIIEADKEIKITRNYDSMRLNRDGLIGRNWTLSIDENLYFLSNGNVEYQDGTGRIYTFIKNSDGTYKTPYGSSFKLTKSKSHTETFQRDSGYYDKDSTPIRENYTVQYYKYTITTSVSDALKEFNHEGRIVSHRVSNGNTHKYHYDTQKNLIRYETSSGKSFGISYNNQGYINQISAPNGTSVKYAYDASGNLSQFVDQQGFKITYHYDTNGRMLSYTERENNKNVVVNEYDSNVRITKQTDAIGNVARFTYGSGFTEITDFNGKKERVYINSRGYTTKIVDVMGQEKTKSYDDRGNLIKEVDFDGKVYQYRYNAQNLLISETNSKGKTATYAYNNVNLLTEKKDFDGKTTKFTYNANKELTSVILPGGNASEIRYENGLKVYEKDIYGNAKTFAYTDKMLSRVSYHDGSFETFEYDSLGFLVKEMSRSKVITTYSYDNRGLLVGKSIGSSVSKFVYDANGNKVQEIDPNGNKTTYTYDGWSRVIKKQIGQEIETYAYDALGNKVETVNALGQKQINNYDAQSKLIYSKDFNGVETHYEYDSNGLLVGSTSSDGHEIVSVYNDLKQLISETRDGRTTKYDYDALGRIASTTDPYGRISKNFYDSLGNLEKEVDTNGVETLYQYHNSRLISKERLGQVTLYHYDIEGNQTFETFEGVKGSENHYESGLLKESILENGVSQTYHYDDTARLISVKSNGLVIKSYTYDGNGNKLSETDAMGNTTSYEYNHRNQIIKTTSALGHRSTIQYDVIGRKVSETVYDSVNDGVYTTSYSYDERGNMSEMVNPMGLSTHYEYDEKMRFTQERFGDKITRYEYDDHDNVIKTITNNLEETKAYDEFDRLIKVEDSSGLINYYEYDDFDRIIRDYDNRFKDISTVYDDLGNRIETTDSRNNTTYYEYDAFSRLIKTTDILGLEEETTYNSLSQIEKIKNVRSTEINKYNDNGTLSEIESSFSGSSVMSYDHNNNVIEIKDVLGNSTFYEYDAQNQLVKETDPLGNTTEYVYDARGNIIEIHYPDDSLVQYQYDALSNQILYVDQLGYETASEYDMYGRLLKQTDALGNSTTSDYDIHDNVIQKTDALGNVETFEYDDSNRLSKETSANGREESYTYDDFGQVIEVRKSEDVSEFYEYNEFGDVLSRYVSGIDDAFETYEYDKYGRLISTRDILGTIQTSNHNQFGDIESEKVNDSVIVEYEFDEHGNIVKQLDMQGLETTYEYDALARVVKESNSLGLITSYEYDANGNIIAVSDDLGTIHYLYDNMGREVKVIDKLGHETQTYYDVLGRVIKTEDALGNSEETAYDELGNPVLQRNALGHEVKRVYDANRNVIKIQEDEGKILTYDYDSENQVTAIHLNDQEIKTIEYDVFGNVVKVDSKDGFIDEYRYDTLGNIIYKKESDREVSYEYDKKMQMVAMISSDERHEYHYDALGQVIEVSSHSGSILYNYDNLGNITSITDVFGNTTQYKTNELGYQSEVVYPSGKVIQKDYDAHGRLITLRDDGSETVYTYDAMDNLLTESTDSLVSEFTYNPNSQVLSHITTLKQDESVSVHMLYNYDAHGLITDIKDELKGTREHYLYDTDSQVIEIQSYQEDTLLETIQYAYDQLGNRTLETQIKDGQEFTTRFVSNASNQLTDMTSDSGKSIHYTYDKYGNVTNKAYDNGFEVMYTFNDLNQLVKIENSDERVIEYRYDGFGNRIERSESYDVLRLMTSKDPDDQEDEIMDIPSLIEKAKEAYTASLTQDRMCMMTQEDSYTVKESTRYVNDLSMDNPVAIETYQNDTLYETVVPQMMSLKHDTKGKEVTAIQNVKADVILEVDESGSLNTFDYDFFGRSLNTNTPSLGYSGESHEGALQYLRARFYDTETGVFISRDTYGGEASNVGSQNRYIYAQNSNINAIDPNGHIWGWIASATQKVVKKVESVAKKVVNVVVTKVKAVVKPVVTVAKKVWQAVTTPYKKPTPVPTPVKSIKNAKKASAGPKSPPVSKQTPVVSKASTTSKKTIVPRPPVVSIPTPAALKKKVETVNLSLKDKLAKQEQQWLKEGYSVKQIDSKRVSFVKAYCDTLGLTSIETSAVVSQYEKLDKAISSASQTANKSWSNSLLDYVSSFGRDMLTYQSDKAINDLEVVKNSDINPFTLLGIVISVAVLASGAIMITGAVTGTAVLSAFMSTLLGTTLTVSNGSLALSGLVSLIAGYINSEYILKNVESDVVRENLNDINGFGMLLNIQGLVTLAINEIGNRGRDWLNKRNQDNSTIDKGTGNVNVEVDNRKFIEYALDPNNSNGKSEIFKSYGYDQSNATELSELYQSQASSKLSAGDYVIGKADQYGQRITIDITIGTRTNTTIIKSGWMLNPDGSIRLLTPFAGFSD